MSNINCNVHSQIPEPHPSTQHWRRKLNTVARKSLLPLALAAVQSVALAQGSVQISHAWWGPVDVRGFGWPSDIAGQSIKVQVSDYATGQSIATRTTKASMLCNPKQLCYGNFSTSFSVNDIGTGRYQSCSTLRITATVVSDPSISASTVFMLPECLG